MRAERAVVNEATKSEKKEIYKGGKKGTEHRVTKKGAISVQREPERKNVGDGKKCRKPEDVGTTLLSQEDGK